MSEWQRSSEIPYPQVWAEFPLFNPSTNKLETGVVIDITENYYETILENMYKFNIQATAPAVLPALLADEVSIAERVTLWRMTLKQRLSLMCVLKQSDGSEVIVGAMINARRSLLDPVPEFQGNTMKRTWAIEEYIYGKSSFYEDFSVTEAITYITAYVLSEFNAISVLLEMFYSRRWLCIATKIQLSLACFSMGNYPNLMQDAATKTGFKEYVRVPYEELASLDRTLFIPKFEYSTLMYKLCTYQTN